MVAVVATLSAVAWTTRGGVRPQLVERTRAEVPAAEPADRNEEADTQPAQRALIVDVTGEHTITEFAALPPTVADQNELESTTVPTPDEPSSADTTSSTRGDETRAPVAKEPAAPATDPSSRPSTVSTSRTTTGPTINTTAKSPTTPPTSPPTTARSTTASTTATSSARQTTSSVRQTTSTTAEPPVDRIVWEEHFNTLDGGRWAREHSTYGDGNGELQCYRPENVQVANGRLILTAKSENYTCPNGSRRDVTSGMIRSRGLTFSPGQAIEFRVKLTPPDPQNQSGLWPAVWASSWAGSWPRGGELDFLEVMTAEDPRRAVFSLHYANRAGSHELQNKAVPMSSYFSSDWHTIRFNYGTNGKLEWFMDGTKVFSVSAADTVQGYPAPFDQTIGEIKINLAVGGRPGPLGSGVLGSAGATFEVDYIKVFNL